MVRFKVTRGSATALRFVADPRYLSNNYDKENSSTHIKFCNPCLPTFLLPISPAGHKSTGLYLSHVLIGKSAARALGQAR